MKPNGLSHALRAGVAALVIIATSCDGEVTYWSYSFDSTTGETNVHILVTDNPAGELRAFHLTLDEVTLVREDGHEETLYATRDGYRLDLFALRDAGAGRRFDLAAPDTRIRSGTYDRLRLRVRDPEVCLRTGETFAPQRIDLAGGGTVEVALERPLRASAGGTLWVVLDFDLERSLDRLWWGNLSWRYRPLVLVESSPSLTAELRRPVDLRGRIVDVAADGCEVALELTGGRGLTRLRLEEGAHALDGATGVFRGTLLE